MRFLRYGPIVLLCLFSFVSFVPHRYVWSPGGIPIEWVALLPSLVITLMLIGTLLGARARADILCVPILSSAVLILFFDFLGALGAESPLTGILRTSYFALTGMAVAVCSYSALRDPGTAHRVLGVMVVVGALVAAYGILEFLNVELHFYRGIFNQANPRYRNFSSEDFDPRILSTVGHPVYLGTYLAALLPLGLHAGLCSRGKAALVYWPAFILLIIGLTLTFTRGAYVAGIVSLLVYGAHHRRHTINIVAAGVICLVVAMMSIDRVWDGLAGRDTMNQLENFRTDQRGLAYAHAAAMLRDVLEIGMEKNNAG